MQGRKFAVQLLDQTEQAGSYSNLLLDHALHQVEMEQKKISVPFYFTAC
mgnify:CR=1 FL=1